MTLFQSQLGFVLVHYAYVLLLGLVSCFVGRVFVGRMQLASLTEEISLAAGLGLGIISNLLFLLGSIGLLYRFAIISVIIIWLVSFNVDQRVFVKRLLNRLRRNTNWRLAFWLLAILLGLPLLVLPLYPPSAWDATEFYLASAKIYVAQHRLVPTPYLRFEVYPQLCQLLFSLGLIFLDDIAAQLTQFLMFVLLVGAVFSFGQREYSRRAGLWSAAILVGNPIILYLASNAYIDIGVTLYLTLSLYTLAVWFGERRRGWLLLCGAFCGFAVGTKYTALQQVALVTLIVGAVCVKRREWRRALEFSSVLLFSGAPSYIRNAILVGNPVFPLLAGIFGSGNYNADDMKFLAWELREHYGVGRSVQAFLALPWTLYSSPKVFHAQAILSPVNFVVLPAILLCAFRNPRIRSVGLCAILVSLLWFLNAQILRHLTPVLPIIAVGGGACLEFLSRRLASFDRWLDKRAPQAIVAAALAFPGWRYAVKEVRANGPLPSSQRARDDYLTKTHVSYPAYQMLNGLRGRHYTLYALADNDMAYFADGTFMGDWFGPGRFAPVLGAMGDGRVLHRELEGLGAEFFLVSQSKFPVVLPADAYWREHFRPLFARNGVLLFEISKAPVVATFGPNLVQNGTFHLPGRGWPLAWEIDGRPMVEDNGNGGIAVRAASGIGCPFQRIAVPGGALLRIQVRARATSQKQEARLEIRYEGALKQMLVVDESLFSVSTEWRSFEMLSVAPETARLAVIEACTGPGSTVVYRDISCQEVTYAQPTVVP
jgi:Dolichyl-phosphate-mannose-protein mannosyltransferase